ncbi:MAG: hypothetical protein P8M30_16655 [Planctomycetaceae bacterium]|nr:hypothetical protein [Planctomycetaceae bacterium]
MALVEAAGIEPGFSESQWEKLQQLTSETDPVAAYLQLVADTLSHSPASLQPDLSYVFARWPQLPQHIRQTIITLVKSVERQPDDTAKIPET